MSKTTTDFRLRLSLDLDREKAYSIKNHSTLFSPGNIFQLKFRNALQQIDILVYITDQQAKLFNQSGALDSKCEGRKI
jgi:hypothetical protein